MRIDAKKVLFVGAASQRQQFFERAQQMGIVEFTLPKSSSAIVSSTPSDPALAAKLDYLLAALKILGRLPLQKPAEFVHLASTSLQATKTWEMNAHAVDLARDVVNLHSEAVQIESQIAGLRLERATALPFGTFSMEDLHTFAARSCRTARFFCCALRRLPQSLPREFIEIARDKSTCFGLSLAKELAMPAPFREVQLAKSASDIDRALGELAVKKEAIAQTFVFKKGSEGILRHALLAGINIDARQRAQGTADAFLGEHLFSAQGWIPSTKLDGLESLTATLEVCALPIASDVDEVEPTCLSNRGTGRIGQDLTEVYDVPAVTDRDPSSWVLWSFVCFFAIIVGDGGYGMLFLACSVLASRKWGAKVDKAGPISRALRLARILSVACIAWGFLSATFFSLPFAPDSSVRLVSPISTLAEWKAAYHFAHKDFVYSSWIERLPTLAQLHSGGAILQNATTLEGGQKIYKLQEVLLDQIALELALVIGVVHICSSLARYALRNWAAVGWIIFLIGAYLYIPDMFEATTLAQYVFAISSKTCASIGLRMMQLGGGLALCLALIRGGLWGVLEVMTLMQIGADVLSYLRLYALGLSGAILSRTINQGATAVGGVAAVAILVTGHSINLGLALMGGVIHGLRLNFLEWYHYSFDGGGRMHNPLAIRKE